MYVRIIIGPGAYAHTYTNDTYRTQIHEQKNANDRV